MQADRIDPFDKELGDIIRIFRLTKGLSQHDLGEPIGISFQQIQKYEKGRNRISVRRLCDVANILKCSPVEILTTHSALGASSPITAELNDLPLTEQSSLLRQYNALPKGKARKLICELMRLLAKSGQADAGETQQKPNDRQGD